MSRKQPYTVILMRPDYLRDDEPREWTTSHHVEAETTEEAFGAAQDEAIAGFYSASDTDKPPPEDFAVIAVYAGHLQDLFIP